MPVKTYPTVSVSALRVGDKVTNFHVGRSTAVGEIARIDKRRTRADITFTSGDEVKYLELSGTCIIERLVETAEEKAAAMLEWKLKHLDRAERGAAEDLKIQQDKMINLLQKGHNAGYYELAQLLEAQATAAVWARVAHVSKLHAEWAADFDAETGTWSVVDTYTTTGIMQEELPILTRLEILEKVREGVRAELLEHYTPTSRSTNVMSNTVEDFEREAKGKFVSSRYMMF